MQTLFIWLCLAVLPLCAENRLSRQPDVAAALEVLDGWIVTSVAEREQPGLSIGIVHDQELIWAKGYGYADLERKVPASPSTLYRIASISKLFTATSILQLRDAGKLRLDDPVASHLEWFRPINRHRDGPVISLRHLLTHTSGLPREAPVSYWNDLNFPSRTEMIRLLASQETVFGAETEFKYSNLAYAIAGEVVAAVSGEPYPRYVEQHILKPLGMTATRVLPRRDEPGLATGYRRRVPGSSRDVAGFVESNGLTPAANLASCVEDLARFVSLQFRDGNAGGAQILKGATLREMHRVQWLRPNWRTGQGLGFAIRRENDLVRAGHGGSVPGHRTQIEFAPESKLGVIVLTNADDGEPMRYVNQAFQLLGPAVAKATRKEEPAPKPDPAWEKYVGTYEWAHSDSFVRILGGRLVLISPQADNPWESRVTLEPVSEHVFRMKGGGSAGELLRFEVDGNGRVRRLVAGAYYLLRKE